MYRTATSRSTALSKFELCTVGCEEARGECGKRSYAETEMKLTLTDTVSFSFTIGTTPMDKSSLNVLTALRYLVR